MRTVNLVRERNALRIRVYEFQPLLKTKENQEELPRFSCYIAFLTFKLIMSAEESKRVKLNDTLKVYKRSEKATLPTRGSLLAAGWDLYSSEESVVPGKGQALVATDISIVVPAGTYGRVAPRSGLAVKHGISTGAGVIDADYRGEVKVVLFNHSDKDFKIEKGDRIAQLVLEKIINADIQEISVEELDATERGAGGFGSTGRK